MSTTTLILTILMIIAAAGLPFWLVKRSKKSKKSQPDTTLAICEKMQQIGTTPLGAKIFGKTLPSAEILNAFDAGMTKNFEIKRQCRGYKNNLVHRNWSIFLIDSFLSPIDKVPSYYYPNPLGASDQMTIAGEYLASKKADQQSWIAIAEPKNDALFAANIVYNELDHGTARHNSPEDYLFGAQPGHFHPEDEDCRINAIRSFKDSKLKLPCGTLNPPAPSKR